MLWNWRPARYITDRGNPAVIAVKTVVMGNGFLLKSYFYRGSGGNGDSYLEISIDYRG